MTSTFPTAPNWPTRAIFHDQGKAIVTADSSQRTVAAMVDVAEIKGWRKLQLSGSKEFQREAWIENDITREP